MIVVYPEITDFSLKNVIVKLYTRKFSSRYMIHR